MKSTFRLFLAAIPLVSSLAFSQVLRAEDVIYCARQQMTILSRDTIGFRPL